MLFILLHDIYMRCFDTWNRRAYRYVPKWTMELDATVFGGEWSRDIYVIYMLDARNSVREPITYLRTPNKLTLGASIVLFASMNRANCAQKITFDLFAFHVHHICNHRTLRKQLWFKYIGDKYYRVFITILIPNRTKFRANVSSICKYFYHLFFFAPSIAL